jgi:hypothetical protein
MKQRSVAYEMAKREFISKAGTNCHSIEYIRFDDNWKVRLSRCSRRGLILSRHGENGEYISSDQRIRDYHLLTYSDISIAGSNL